MTDEKRTCWICGELGYGETDRQLTHICFVCRAASSGSEWTWPVSNWRNGIAATARDAAKAESDK